VLLDWSLWAHPHGSIGEAPSDAERDIRSVASASGSGTEGTELSGSAQGAAPPVRRRLRYPFDLTEEEWALIEPRTPPARRGGNKRTVSLREVVNGLTYILSSGCQ
jgi:hypothetical protein